MADQKTILIVEDDKFLSSLIKARLEKENFSIAQAFDGEEGRQYLKKSKPDLILLDLIMPRVPGFELLEGISLDPNLNKIPVVVLTNLAQESDIKKAKQLGATEYYVKVRTSIDDLVKKIKTLLNVA